MAARADGFRISRPGKLVHHEVDDVAGALHLLQPRPQRTELDVSLDHAAEQRVQVVDGRAEGQDGLIRWIGSRRSLRSDGWASAAQLGCRCRRAARARDRSDRAGPGSSESRNERERILQRVRAIGDLPLL